MKGINKNQKISKYFKRFKTFQKILKDLKGTSQKIAKIPTERFQKSKIFKPKDFVALCNSKRQKAKKQKHRDFIPRAWIGN